jgi:hypothetical protein
VLRESLHLYRISQKKKDPLGSDPRHQNLKPEDTPPDGSEATRGEDGGGLGANMIRRRLATIGVTITLLVALGVPRTDGKSFPIISTGPTQTDIRHRNRSIFRNSRQAIH